VFFPTFRRIEGGFSINKDSSGGLLGRSKFEIEESLIGLSKRLSQKDHVFVAALSTVDVVLLLTSRYAELNEAANNLQKETSKEIINTIKNFKEGRGELNAANQVIDGIRIQIESMEALRKEMVRPLSAIQKLVLKLFRHSGIKLGDSSLKFGEAASAISSDSLSAGEKQMLSFISYNAFYRDSVIVIDEPELSLHVDWQRSLFPTLLSQHSTNQFIIATHSPFIYTRYQDKELQIDADRGAES
jgi:predicted ATP-binding protein involved in virulence